jgi:hypothetical protein
MENYNKNYYNKNKDKILQSMTKKIECISCKKHISKCNMNKHYNSVKHQKNLEIAIHYDVSRITLWKLKNSIKYSKELEQKLLHPLFLQSLDNC